MLTRTLYRYEKHQKIDKTDQEWGKTAFLLTSDFRSKLAGKPENQKA